MIDSKILDCIQDEKVHYFSKSFPKFFSWKDLENLLNLRPFLTDKRFHNLSKDESLLSWKHQAWVTDQTTCPPSKVAYFLQNHSCYLQDASRVSKEINQICKQLEDAFDADCDAHIFFNVSTNLEEGFGIHFDKSHNLIVQIEGESEVKVWEDMIEPSDDIKPIIDKVMFPGDAVFIPMNVYHSVKSLTQRMSISFPINFGFDKQKQDRSWIVLDY